VAPVYDRSSEDGPNPPAWKSPIGHRTANALAASGRSDLVGIRGALNRYTDTFPLHVFY
jgi:hypothetical protein